jgi:hypothetical protein
MGKARQDSGLELLGRRQALAALPNDGEELDDVFVVESASRATAQVLVKRGQELGLHLLFPNQKSRMSRSLTIHGFSLATELPAAVAAPNLQTAAKAVKFQAGQWYRIGRGGIDGGSEAAGFVAKEWCKGARA